MPRPRLVLVNPPGTQLYIRGYFCSQTSKADYLIQPIDFICLSGYLARDFELHLVDAIRDRLSVDETLAHIRALRPEVAVCLVGMASLAEDRFFTHALKRTGIPLVAALGDYLLGETRPAGEVLPGLDRILTSFIDDPVLTTDGANANPSLPSRMFSLPIPQHQLFLHAGYSFPFARHAIHATVLTDFGCPFSCSFCVMGTLGYRYRPVENVLEELSLLHDLRVRELFFIDQSFAVIRSRTEAILQAMIRRRWSFGWTCYSRVDLVDRELLQLMKRAGCHTIMFGVESGSEEILEHYGKGYTLSQVHRAFRWCRESGLRTVGTFLLGFPEDTHDTCLSTIRLARSLRCDFASFNFAFPRKNTVLSQTRAESPVTPGGDQSGRRLATGTRHLSVEDLECLRDRAIREFYFRPGHLLRQLLRLRGRHEVFSNVKNAYSLLKRLFSPSS